MRHKQKPALVPVTDSQPDKYDEQFIEKIVADVVEAKKGGNLEKFYIYYAFGIPALEAARRSGYSEKSAYSLLHKIKHNPATREKMMQVFNSFPDIYRMFTKSRLPQIAQIESAALTEYKSNPLLAISKPRLLKDLKISAGVIEEETAPNVQTINIEQIQAIILQNAKERKEELVNQGREED